MRPDELSGKAVIDTEAQVLGEVCGLEFSPRTWRITHLSVKLSDTAVESLGFQKPRLRRRVRVEIPVETVKTVSDIVSLNRSIGEIGEVAKRR